MGAPRQPTLRIKIDDFSLQVDSAEDDGFWLRLEREPNRDVITDYFLGGFPQEEAGRLLSACCKALNLRPAMTLVFRDILPARGEPDPQALENARAVYAQAASELLTEFGAREVSHRLERVGDKHHLTAAGRL